MRDFLAHTLDSPADGVLLPAFIGWSPREGSGVFDPILEVGARAGFYDLNADLTVNLADLEQRLISGSFRVIVLIHYFGRTEPNVAAIRAMADEHGTVLVEDLAHGFFSAAGAGEAGRHGQVRMFSLHKMFPFADGGLVSYADIALLTGQESTKPDLAARILSYDWRAISELRRENFLNLTERLVALPECGTAFELIWPGLGEYDVPQTLPVRIVGLNRDDIYAGMNAEGFGMVSLYHTLIEQTRAGFAGLDDLSRHIINFPVHQDVPSTSIAAMIDSFRRHLRGQNS
jgi:dTDP-4-amino-4,6-dideoxygalactose transaminase